MAIAVGCPACGKQLRVKDEFAGKRVKCPSCGQILALPSSPPASPPVVTHRGAALESLRQGLAHDAKGDWDGSIAHFTQALRLDPKLADAYVYRAKAHFQKDEDDKAI